MLKRLNPRSRNIDEDAKDFMASKDYKMTLTDVAQYLKINVGLFKDYESGKRKPDKIDRRKIEMFFGKDMFPDICYECDYCQKCKRYKAGKCGGQPYFVKIFNCPKHNVLE